MSPLKTFGLGFREVGLSVGELAILVQLMSAPASTSPASPSSTRSGTGTPTSVPQDWRSPVCSCWPSGPGGAVRGGGDVRCRESDVVALLEFSGALRVCGPTIDGHRVLRPDAPAPLTA